MPVIFIIYLINTEVFNFEQQVLYSYKEKN